MESNSEKKIISIVADDGSIDEVEVILSFQFKDSQKEYVIYTKNEKDANGNITIYVSNVVRDGSNMRFTTVQDEAEWGRIKDLLRELAKAE
ncbi:MAG: DUF1292 domain-containing protein [Bacilli bacterium]